ncbi:MAG TPA: ParA family protein [Pseudomonadota bacterium]|nr:ParA family protein [Pseudomonadota bacterium]
MPTRILAVASQKGGSGKSTLVTGLAASFISSGLSVCVLDADSPQHTLLRWWEVASTLPHFAPLTVEPARQADLHGRALPAADLVLIDCPGRVDAIVRSALVAADALVVPLQPTYPDSWALAGLVESVAAAVQARKRALPGFVVLNRIKRGTRLAKQAEGLGQLLPAGFTLLDARLRDLQGFQVAMGAGDTPLGLEPGGPAAEDLSAVAAELLKHVRIPDEKRREKSAARPAAAR